MILWQSMMLSENVWGMWVRSLQVSSIRWRFMMSSMKSITIVSGIMAWSKNGF